MDRIRHPGECRDPRTKGRSGSHEAPAFVGVTGCSAAVPSAPKEKAPALSGRGSAVSAGRGEGMPITAGGYKQNVAPAFGFPKKIERFETGGLSQTKRPGMRAEALRRQLPLQATISRPRLSL